MAYTGGCQCGKVRYRAEEPRGQASICFCRMCQKATGAPFMAVVRFRADQVSWSAEPAVFRSSNVAERGFCPACGTPLTYRDVRGPNLCLAIGTLDEPHGIAPEASLAGDQKAPWLDGLGGLPPSDHDLSGVVGRQWPDGAGAD